MSPLLRVTAAALAVLAGAGCPAETNDPADAGPDAGPIGCKLEFLGDETKDIELEIIALDANYKSHTVEEGGPIALMFPPQGGRVIFAGVRATNVDPCGAKIAGAIRDLATKQVSIDTRTVNLELTGDGWGRSAEDDISTFSNIPACPNQWSDTDIFGTEYELIITLTDRKMRTKTMTARVVPACSEPKFEAECRCICHGGYILGEKCADAGAGP